MREPSVHYAMVMAGGAGTRFWPASRLARPKQLLPLLAGRTMLRATVERLRGLVPVARTLVLTGVHLDAQVREELALLPGVSVLSEPVARNTAPCVALACAWLMAGGVPEDAVLGVFPADHWIGDEAQFRQTCAAAYAEAERGGIVTIGIRPTAPETGYGYIQHGPIAEDGVADALRFHEKPTAARALELLVSGEVLWNAGMFFFRLDVMRDELRRQLPELAAVLPELGERARAGDEAGLRALFEPLPSISVDHGVMEGARRMRVVQGAFPWSDVGHWDALPQVAEVDRQGNVVRGAAVITDCSGCVIVNESGRLVTALGLSNMVVVDTGDALLVMPRERAQEVRQVVERVRELDETLL